MKKTLFLLFVFLFLCRGAFPQARPENFVWGAGAMLTQPLEHAQLVKEGRTHLRRVWRAKAQYPGGGLPPNIFWDETEISGELNAAKKAGFKGFVFGLETTRQENAAAYRGDAVRFNGAYRRFFKWLRGIRTKWPSTRIVVEPFAGEPGFTTDARAELGALATNAQVYALAQTRLDRVLDEIERIKGQEYPTLTIAWPMCGYGASAGPSSELLFLVKRRAGYISLHAYQPRRFSHADGVSYPKEPLWSWPQPDWASKLPATEDKVTYAYVDGYMEWSRAGLERTYDNAILLAKTFGMPPFVAECGTTKPLRDLAPYKAFVKDIREILFIRSVPGTEWLG